MPVNSPTTTFRFPVDIRRLPSTRRLAADYSYDFDRLATFFAGRPEIENEASWKQAIGRAQRFERPRAAMAQAIVEQQRRRQAPAPCIAAAEKLADPECVAVVTGQHAGLFGGPLYTLLKAITAVKLAAEVTERYGVPAVPIFWVESEDHDWNEVATCSVLGRDLDLRNITVPHPATAADAPVSSVVLDGLASPAIDELRAALVATEFTPSLLERLEAAYKADHASMSDAFSRWLTLVLGESGLIVHDASDKAVKPFAASIFAGELKHPGTSAALAAEAGQQLQERGYHVQATPAAGSVALFYMSDGHRVGIHASGDEFVVGDTTFSAVELTRRAEQDPSSFSPNVLLRPVVQDSLFPTVAYVAGPNELAYLAQLGGIYQHFGVPMPLMYPRGSATLLDSSTAKFLVKSEVAFEALARDDEAELNRLLEQQLPASVEKAWQEARDNVTERMQALIGVLPQVDATLEGAAKSALGRMTHDFDTLHSKIIHAAKRRDETLRRQFEHARSLAFPGGTLQERSVGFVYFLNRYGPFLVERLMSDLPLEVGQHWLLSV